MSIFKYTIRQIICIALCCSVTLQGLPQQKADSSIHVEKEEDFYTIQSVPIPDNIILEVGGMTFMPNDELAVSTRRGEVWLISNPCMKNGSQPIYRLFAQGMHEVLGLNYISGDLYAVQRSELTRLRDRDGDGEADEYLTVYSWPLTGNYHEYSYGPILDKEGNFVLTLNLAWVRDHGESLSKWHGWMIKITPDGTMKPFAAGLRSPAGFGLNGKGDIFYAENQGDWVGSGGITHLAAGDFAGNPASLVWSGEPASNVKLKKEDIPDTNEPKYDVAQRVTGIKPTSVWFPHGILGVSTSDILDYSNNGSMGPFEGQLFVGDQGQSKIMRVYTEQVKGEYQGIVFPFREGFSSGILRMKWGSDSSMFVGMTSRGWGSSGGKLYGLQRMVWNGKTAFEMKTVQAKPDGFEITFTQPVDLESAKDPSNYTISRFTYQYHHNYGSPVINEAACPLRAIEVSTDRMKVRLVVDSLRAGYIHEIKTDGVLSATRHTLLHPVGYYTLNQFPEGPALIITDANRVGGQPHHHDMKMPTPGTEPAKLSVTAKRIIKQPAAWTSGPDKTFTLGTKPGMKFDTDKITVKAGMRIKVLLRNNDDMPHNFVITKIGAADRVGEAATKLGLNGEKMSFVPNLPEVLYHTRLVGPTDSEAIYFTAPDKPGQYPFLCTYPGHYLVMRGLLVVTP